MKRGAVRSVGSLDNKTLAKRVYAHLKEEIFSNRIAPGAELQEVPLAESLGVSRGPIREALVSLAAEGLVTITPRRGAVVASLSRRDFLDAYQLREALEALAVALAVPLMAEEEFEAADALIAAMQHSSEVSDDEGFFAANNAFHELFVLGSGNSRLVEAYRRLIAQMRPYRRPSAVVRGSYQQSIAEHRAIIDAARAGDGERAAALVQDHIRIPQVRLDQFSEEDFAVARSSQG